MLVIGMVISLMIILHLFSCINDINKNFNNNPNNNTLSEIAKYKNHLTFIYIIHIFTFITTWLLAIYL